MISDGTSGDEQRDQTAADQDQTSADRDQTSADQDQTSADRDQEASDRDQLAADADQLSIDSDRRDSPDREAYERSRAVRASGADVRRESARDRSETAADRDGEAALRDTAATERDRAAEARDREADARDDELARMAAGPGSDRAITAAQIIGRAALDRRRAASDRARAATHRAQAAEDRRHAAEDRSRAEQDRRCAETERTVAAIDTLTGAQQRGPGLQHLTREIDRARRDNGQLVVVFVDVDGLKASNDTQGHSAGDALLTHIVAVIQAHLRSYEQITRFGGDEFLCVLSNTTIETARSRFDGISTDLARSPRGGSISIGVAQLADDDSTADLINRADTDLLRTRARTRSDTHTQPA